MRSWTVTRGLEGLAGRGVGTGRGPLIHGARRGGAGNAEGMRIILPSGHEPLYSGACGFREGNVAIRMRLDTMAGETFLRLDGAVPEEGGPRLALVTRGEELARLLEGALAFSFSHEVPERPEEDEVVERFLRDCSEYGDVPGLPESLREEMAEHFGKLLESLWGLDWLVFGDARETVLPGEVPVRGRAVMLCLARYDSPAVEMDARLRRYMASFKEAVARIEGRSSASEGGTGGLLH